jgi:hypothetical protein
VHVVDNSALRNKIAHSILIVVIPPPSPDEDATFSLSAPSAPCSLSYDVLIRSGTKQLGHGSLCLPKGSPDGCFIRPNVLSHLPTHIDLLLHPDPNTAAATLDITEICAGDITLPNLSTIHNFHPTPALPPRTTQPAPR